MTSKAPTGHTSGLSTWWGHRQGLRQHGDQLPKQTWYCHLGAGVGGGQETLIYPTNVVCPAAENTALTWAPGMQGSSGPCGPQCWGSWSLGSLPLAALL